jgi:putative DNA primase/helicase
MTGLDSSDSEFSPDLPAVPPAEQGGASLRLRALSEVQPRQVRWLVPGLIPLRTLTLVAGVGGLGKSTWLAAIAAQVSAGELGEPGDVILVSFEDPAAEVLRPRVEAAGGDLTRVHEIVVPRLTASTRCACPGTLPTCNG